MYLPIVITIKTMNVYQKASNALKDAMKVALDDDHVDSNTLSELWRHFLGVQSIAEKLKDVGNYSINTGSSMYDYSIYSPHAADTISFDTQYGQDVVTFS